MTATAIEPQSVWFPTHKSRGTYLVVESIDSGVATVVRYAKGEDPCPMTIRESTLRSRYEEETV